MDLQEENISTGGVLAPHPLLPDGVHGVADDGNQEVDQDEVGQHQIYPKQDHGEISGSFLGDQRTAETLNGS